MGRVLLSARKDFGGTWRGAGGWGGRDCRVVGGIGRGGRWELRGGGGVVGRELLGVAGYDC